MISGYLFIGSKRRPDFGSSYMLNATLASLYGTATMRQLQSGNHFRFAVGRLAQTTSLRT
ncbi:MULTISPECIES: hypothetical protein [unclassified Ensifer]|uniref:hypothetical protein n=1 Tax=unclassified Ensifer TaxID=2633371 RepID=UPI001146518F|nr:MULTISPECIES: hypothetical protein [unclassified Ensifer]